MCVALGACTKAPAYSKLPRSQAQFCEALDQARAQYDKADELDNAIAKTKAIDEARRTRRQALMTALEEGSFIGWIAQVENVSSSSTHLALDVRPPCQTKTLLKQLTPRTKQDEEFLASLKIGSWVLVSGSFSPNDSSDGFQELSVTDSGSLREPEYSAGFALIKPVNGSDERYPDEVQPKLAASVKAHRTKFLERLKSDVAQDDMLRAAFNVCEAAQAAVNAQVKNKVTFPSCFMNIGAFKISKKADTLYRIEGPFTFENAFGAERKAFFHADVEEGPQETDPLTRYKVVDIKLID
jgi:hypothetical protein